MPGVMRRAFLFGRHLFVDLHQDEFDEYTRLAEEMGFTHAACGPLVRSSYHADKQAHGEKIVSFTSK
jgi:lipoic acid synthetase